MTENPNGGRIVVDIYPAPLDDWMAAIDLLQKSGMMQISFWLRRPLNLRVCEQSFF